MNTFVSAAKALLPDKQISLPILCGPLRGGRFYANPRVSLRKVFGLYEAELNGWLAVALRTADVVIDVGANDGYFTFGCAAVMRRMGKPVRVLSFEPQQKHVEQLEAARERSGFSAEEITIIPRRVGNVNSEHMVTLDHYFKDSDTSKVPLLKIDVEGAEVEVLEGASLWLTMRTLLLVEVHHEILLKVIPERFEKVAGPFERVDQKALPFIGRERRAVGNWWLVSAGGKRS